METYTLQKILKIFNPELNRNSLIKAEEKGQIPLAGRNQTGSIERRSWTIEDLPQIGEKIGFLKKPETSVCATVFVTKGGVLKTTITLNLARLAALHNIKTCIVGLDMQADITHVFNIGATDEETFESLEDVDKAAKSVPTLLDFQQGKIKLKDLIYKTDLPTLDIIPESSDLVILEANLQTQIRRESWLKENVVAPLLKEYDLVLIDSPPSWNLLITNALTATDILISPAECKINHYRNITNFTSFIEQFKAQAKVAFKHIFIPTKLVSNRKLAGEIRQYYMKSLPNCLGGVIKESTAGEESMAQSISLLEYAAGKAPADEMKDLIVELWRHIEEAAKEKSIRSTSKSSQNVTKELSL